MERKYLISCLVTIIIASVLLIPVNAHSQELTPEQKQVRCQNNRDRIVELDKQLKRTNDSLAQIPEKKEIEDARSYLSYIRKFKNPNNPSIDPRNKSDENFIKIKRIAVQYNFDFEKCIYKAFHEGEEPNYVSKFCYSELEKIIVKKIDKDVSLQSRRSVLINKKNETEKQLAAHRNNFIVYRCDEPADNNKTVDISGNWAYGTEWVYTITQNGMDFTWYMATLNEKAKGTITGKSVSATWFYKDGSVKGSGTGTVKVDASGRATQIDWSNGVGFKRN